jgi:serine/threonine-protein kinase
MAPEYIRTGKPDPRSDLFAVGVMLYECLSGRKPFAGDTTPTVLYKIVNEAPDPIDLALLHGISPAIRTVLDRALCKNPDERFQTAEDFAKALRAAKDPSWMGQIEEATTQLHASASAPTAPVPSATPTPSPSPSSALTAQTPMAPPTPAPAARPVPQSKGSGKGLWIGLAALGLVAVGGASWWMLKGRGSATSTLVAEAKPGLPTSEPPSVAAGSATKPTTTPGSSVTQVPQTGPSAKPAGEAPSKPEPSYQTRPEPTRPPATKPVEAKAIDQPDLYKQDKLDNMQVHERLNLGNVSLSESIQLADSQPDKAIQGFRQAIKADPYNVNAHAWLGVVLYEQGRTNEFIQELREAHRLGILGQMSARNVRFRSVFNQARFNRKLPPDLAG